MKSILTCLILLLAACLLVRAHSSFYKTKVAVWTSGMETFNLKQAYPDHGLYNETQIADSVPTNQDLLVLLEIYEDQAAVEIIDRLKSYYPYYYRPRKVTGTSECFASEAFTEQIVKESNALNRLYNYTTDLLPEPSSNAFTRCLTAPRDRYIYKGGTGFLVLSKKRIRSLSGRALPVEAIGLSGRVKTSGLVEATSTNDEGVFVESPAVVMSRGYLQFQYNGLKILALYNPFYYSVNSREVYQLDLVKNALNGSFDKFDVIMGDLNSGLTYQNETILYLKDVAGYRSLPMPTQENDGQFAVDWGTQYPNKNTYCWNNLFPRCGKVMSHNLAQLDYILLKKESRRCKGVKFIGDLPQAKPWSYLPYNNETLAFDRFTQKGTHAGIKAVLRYKVQ